MRTVKEILNSNHALFYNSIDVAQLLAGQSELVAEVEKADLSIPRLTDETTKQIVQTNRDNMEYLSLRIGTKALLLQFFYDHTQDSYQKLVDFAQPFVSYQRVINAAKTVALISNAVSYATEYLNFVTEYKSTERMLQDSDGNVVVDNADTCRIIVEKFQQLLTALEQFPEASLLFENFLSNGNRVVFPNVKGDLCDRITVLKGTAEYYIREFAGKVGKDFLNKCAKVVDSYKYDYDTYYPAMPSGENKLSNTVLLYTPYEEEALLFICKNLNCPLLRIQAGSFEGRSQEELDSISLVLSHQKEPIVVFGIEGYHGNNKLQLLMELVKIGRSGKNVYIVEKTSNRKVYEEVLNSVGEYGLSALDISYYYLTMPIFSQFMEILKEKGMVVDEATESDFIRENFPYVGFVGLNDIIRMYASGDDWKLLGPRLSQGNARAGLVYLENLPTQSLLLDKGWGDIHNDLVESSRAAFDYDLLSDVDQRNVRTIVESSTLNIFQKCGCLVRYCTLAGDDVARWQDLPDEEIANRLTFATVMLYELMCIPIVPIVEIREEIEKGVAGFCSGGGKLIVYSKSYSRNHGGIISTICHECYHAFQHTVCDGAWKDWYWTDFGVTQGRRDEWRYNFNNYQDGVSAGSKSKAFAIYMVQVVESEARAFEKDCINQSESVFKSIDLV